MVAYNPRSEENAHIWGPIVVVVWIVAANILAWAANERSWLYRRLWPARHMPRLLLISNR